MGNQWYFNFIQMIESGAVVVAMLSFERAISISIQTKYFYGYGMEQCRKLKFLEHKNLVHIICSCKRRSRCNLRLSRPPSNCEEHWRNGGNTERETDIHYHFNFKSLNNILYIILVVVKVWYLLSPSTWTPSTLILRCVQCGQVYGHWLGTG